MKIVGAGLAGCIAGFVFPNAEIYEAAESIPNKNHWALLRFRSDAVSNLTGVPFEKVHVNKYIFSKGEFVQPNPRLINEYSLKTNGKILSRSIADIEPCVRYIPPDDFHQQLIGILNSRINFGCPIKFQQEHKEKIISTIPLPHVLKSLGKSPELLVFASEAISVEVIKLEGCNVHQTVYFPDLDFPVYRASIVKDMWIIESLRPLTVDEIAYVSQAFFSTMPEGFPIYSGSQKLGKIVPLDEKIRKNMLFDLSISHNIWSLGRYACWRNIMLDDVYYDAYKIRDMINQTHYDIKKETFKDES